ncbi:hypothetical protein [Streptomyces sp. CB03234]|uniref:hypothetical protein n=1 Tax=Streptomyces sp. (strain CB03234) TaxID=1703937 RepID=UPI00268A880A
MVAGVVAAGVLVSLPEGESGTRPGLQARPAPAMPSPDGAPPVEATAGASPSGASTAGSAPTASPAGAPASGPAGAPASGPAGAPASGPAGAPASGPGAFAVAPADGATGPGLRYRVEVEDGSGVDPVAAAEEIAAVLADPRGWGHGGTRSFRRVTGADAGLVIRIATRRRSTGCAGRTVRTRAARSTAGWGPRSW